MIWTLDSAGSIYLNLETNTSTRNQGYSNMYHIRKTTH